MNPYSSIDMSVVQSAEHRALAVKAAQMSFTLLKNDGNALPFKGTVQKLAVGTFVVIKRPVRDACLCMGELQAPPALPAPAAPHFVFLITL